MQFGIYLVKSSKEAYFCQKKYPRKSPTMEERDVLHELLAKLEQYHHQESSAPMVNYLAPEELRRKLQLQRDGVRNFPMLLEWIDNYLEYSVRTSHPDFVNRMWAGANLPSILGELTTAFTNTSACTYESAPVATLMENFMIDQMLELTGFVDGEGQMTTGSSNGNMIAMMCARNLAQQDTQKKGLYGAKRLVALVNLEAHYSMDRAANTLGIGSDNLIKIPVDKQGRMLMDAVEETFEKCLKEDAVPFFVAATAGTTVRGAYDSIAELVALKKKYSFWLHVDGAWGGAALMSSRLKDLYLRGLEEADSFTCDFHKMLGSSLMCNFLLLNNSKDTFKSVISDGDTSYLFRHTEDAQLQDPGALSLQCGRRVDALKWFLDWKYFGREGFAERVENSLALCSVAEKIVLKSAELELVVPRTSFNICFRFLFAGGDQNQLNAELRKRLYTSGETLVGIAYVQKTLVLRLVLCNENLDESGVESFFEKVIRMGRALQQELS